MRNNFLLSAAIFIVSLFALLPTHNAFANEESEKLNAQGLEYFNAGNYEAAITEFSAALKIEPNNSTYRNNIGWTYFSWGQAYYAPAEENFKESIRLDVDHNSAYRGLARLYRAQGKNDDAINNFTEAGKKYYNKDDYPNAITDFTDAINLGAENAEIYNLRGLSHYNLENPDYEAALNDFNKALDCDKNFAPAFYNCASVYRIQDNQPDAITNFMQAGKKYLSAKSYDDAKEAFNLVLELDPKNGEAYYRLGRVEYFLTKWQEAINNYDKAVELNFAEDYVYTNRGFAKYKLKHYDDAIKDFNKALEIDVTHADAYQWRGESYLSLTKPDYEKAMADFESYLKFAENLDDDTVKSYQDKIDLCKEALKKDDPFEKLKQLVEKLGLGEFNNFLKVLFITMLIYSAGLVFLGVRERNTKYVGTFVVTNGIILLLLMLANELDVRNFFIIIAVGYMLIELIKKADAAGIPALQWIIDLITKFRDGSSGQGRR